MKIVTVERRVFAFQADTQRDSDGHSHPGPIREARNALLTITCDDGTVGHAIAAPAVLEEDLIAAFARPVLLGADPLRIEKHWYALYKWQRGSGGRLTDRVLCAVELALWDLVGKKLGQPVWKLLGGYRDKHPRLWQHHVRRRPRGRAQDARGLWPLRRLAGEGARLQGREAAHLDAADPGCPRRAARLRAPVRPCARRSDPTCR